MKKILIFLSIIATIIFSGCDDKSREKDMMIGTQSVRTFLSDRVITVTNIDSITGTDFNIVTVIQNDKRTLMNAICPRSRSFQVGEVVKLSVVSYHIINSLPRDIVIIR